MSDSFDTAVLIRAMRKESPDEDIFIEKSNGKRLVLHPQDDISDICGYLMIQNSHRDVAINPQHIISIITKGDL